MDSDRTPATIEPAPASEAYDENGIDRSLVRYMLSLTPSERLAHVQDMIDLVEASVRARPR